ncbi:MAG: single-stranded DNA-binding protein [Stackebrandtia sp.]
MIYTHIVEGRIAAKPTMTVTRGGHEVTHMRVLFNDRRRDASGAWQDGRTRSLDVACWRHLAQRAAGLATGDLVIVECANDLTATVNGRYVNLQVSAKNISLSMRFEAATSHRKSRRPAGDTVVTGEGEVYTAQQWQSFGDAEHADPIEAADPFDAEPVDA